jgi:pSer/pThr/pTyr-binding forkhead associated (FHA) protein
MTRALVLRELRNDLAVGLELALPRRGQEATLGTDPAVELRIPYNVERLVARRQCRFRMEEDLVILDLHSSNPTLLNGQAVTSAVVVPGDRISLGNAYEFTVVEVSGIPTQSASPQGREKDDKR